VAYELQISVTFCTVRYVDHNRGSPCTRCFQQRQSGARKFDHAELFSGTSTGQKKAGGSTKGSLIFNSEKKMVEFQAQKGSEVISIPYGQVKSLLYEQASKPRYTEAVLISPMFLLAHSKKHYLTIQYTDANGTGQYAIVQLDKKNAQDAVAAAQAETGKDVERVEEK
jgi:hypothetical protein